MMEAYSEVRISYALGAIVFPNVYAGLSTMASKKSYLPNFVGATSEVNFYQLPSMDFGGKLCFMA